MKEQRRKGHYITIERSIDREDIPKNMDYTKPKLIELNEEINREIHNYIWEPRHPTLSNL